MFLFEIINEKDISKMISKILVAFIPIVIFLCLCASVLFLLQAYKLRRKSRKSPLTNQLLRSPGDSLRHQIEKLTEDIDYYLIIILFSPLILYATYLTQKYYGELKEGDSVIIIFIIIAFTVVVSSFFKLWKLLKDRHAYRLGLDCETSVGQELNQLMLKGCRVFHDFPIEKFNKKFNIDHIVVSPKGVFAVETKGRAKPLAESTVVYDGEMLKFPSWTEKEPLEQARRNAKWLSEWLSNTVGENISVNPVLAIPGWYIEREITDDIFIFNGKNPQNLLLKNDSLPETLIKKISYQLEQKCRDVGPTAYQQNKRK
jgi:hypothetical protein